MKMERLAEGITLYLGDCREILPTIGRVDAVVTDPPYGIGENSKKVASRQNAAVVRDYGAFDWDRQPISADMIASLRATSQYQIIFGGNFFDGLGPTSCWLVWDKLNSGDFADCELAWTNLDKAVRRIQYRWNGMIREERDVPREHPTQKPINVMTWCISQIPPPATLILDPFMGSGTTGVAAVKLGRKFIGVEIEPKYFDIACRRISEELRKPDMFIEKPKPLTQEAML